MPPTNEHEKLVGRKVGDSVKAVLHSGVPRYLGFFNLREAELAQAEINRLQWQHYTFFGGFPGAERTMLCLYYPDDPKAALPQHFPLLAVLAKIAGAQAQQLTHRDFLGAVLGAGIKRECVGDIVKSQEGMVILLQASVVPFLQQELTQVGRASITLERCALPEDNPVRLSEPRTASVSSLRTDAVLAAMLNVSRGEAAAHITKGLVQINHLSVETVHYLACEGDIFSIRGLGKFLLQSVGGKSRKDRTFIEFSQYC